MAIKNNVTEYETPLRENFELTASATALLGALGYEAYAQFGDFPAGQCTGLPVGSHSMDSIALFPPPGFSNVI